MKRFEVKDAEGTLIVDCEIRADGTVIGMAKDGYDVIIDGEELESTIARS